MKNIILGISGGLVLIYTIVICLTIYGNSSRSNEVEYALSQVVMSTLKENYVAVAMRDAAYQPATEEAVLKEVQEKLLSYVDSDTNVSVSLRACDMEKGILSVSVKETYKTPLGQKKEACYEKTAIVESP